MPKPTLEFTPVSQFPLTKGADSQSADYRILSEDPETGDKTIILTHPPGQEWGGSGGKDTQAEHIYWEEVLILRGRIYDKTLQQWFSGENRVRHNNAVSCLVANYYCCRPPGMLHGPWIADSEEGCEELVIVRH
ncbi:hypothetical protein B0H11DRAFT_1951242 [Mycena galericulata]|nr:hypothetical protein B0H11DRAFT_1951242 [Mycena galericulata]